MDQRRSKEQLSWKCSTIFIDMQDILLGNLYDKLMREDYDELDPNQPVNHQTEGLPYDRKYELIKEQIQFGEVSFYTTYLFSNRKFLISISESYCLKVKNISLRKYPIGSRRWPVWQSCKGSAAATSKSAVNP